MTRPSDRRVEKDLNDQPALLRHAVVRHSRGGTKDPDKFKV